MELSEEKLEAIINTVVENSFITSKCENRNCNAELDVNLEQAKKDLIELFRSWELEND